MTPGPHLAHQPQKSLLGCVVTIAKPEHEDDVLLDLDEGPSREEKTWD